MISTEKKNWIPSWQFGADFPSFIPQDPPVTSGMIDAQTSVVNGIDESWLLNWRLPRLPPIRCDKMWWITQLGTPKISTNLEDYESWVDVIDSATSAQPVVDSVAATPILAEQRSTWHSSCHWFFSWSCTSRDASSCASEIGKCQPSRS